uniref:Uncharacterized protein n=1 Tax=Ditylum brightwellii TaxID=49249 RepID=A0A7S1ZFA6_9STRA|mmetsp:Transcript_30730/g.45821  ORF Transcript_30730/g.45821 Transcript_30730/m.45821 type:complete len:238 (+) Transcript_30730:75-788(+)
MDAPTKELVLVCAGGIKGALDVKEKDTLADVRCQIEEEFDDDLIVPDFAFHVDGIRISQKQEKKKLGWQIVGKVVSLHSRRIRKLEEAVGNEQSQPSKKRALEDASAPININVSTNGEEQSKAVYLEATKDKSSDNAFNSEAQLVKKEVIDISEEDTNSSLCVKPEDEEVMNETANASQDGPNGTSSAANELSDSQSPIDKVAIVAAKADAAVVSVGVMIWLAQLKGRVEATKRKTE